MDKRILSVLQEMEEYKKHSEVGLWNVSWKLGEFLAKLVEERKPKVIIEIGSSNGFSGIWMAEAASSYGGQLYTIESSPKRIPLARENFEKSGLKNIHFMEGHAPELFLEFPKNLKVDMVFLDATKKQYLEFFKGLKPYLSNETLFIADNILSHPEPVKPYLDFMRKNFESSTISMDAGLEITTVRF